MGQARQAIAIPLQATGGVNCTPHRARVTHANTFSHTFHRDQHTYAFKSEGIMRIFVDSTIFRIIKTTPPVNSTQHRAHLSRATHAIFLVVCKCLKFFEEVCVFLEKKAFHLIHESPHLA